VGQIDPEPVGEAKEVLLFKKAGAQHSMRINRCREYYMAAIGGYSLSASPIYGKVVRAIRISGMNNREVLIIHLLH
jgi:hypothetical protein